MTRRLCRKKVNGVMITLFKPQNNVFEKTKLLVGLLNLV